MPFEPVPARAAAKASGAKHYHGSPCGRCGGTLRWTNCKNCVACLRAANKARIAKKREAGRGQSAS